MLKSGWCCVHSLNDDNGSVHIWKCVHIWTNQVCKLLRQHVYCPSNKNGLVDSRVASVRAKIGRTC